MYYPIPLYFFFFRNYPDLSIYFYKINISQYSSENKNCQNISLQTDRQMIYIQIYYNELIHAIIEAEKSQDFPLASGRARSADNIVSVGKPATQARPKKRQFFSSSPKAREDGCVSHQKSDKQTCFLLSPPPFFLSCSGL